MRTAHTLKVSLPPAMLQEIETMRKAENRTRSELVHEALRTYFSFLHKFPAVPASKAELSLIRRGRRAFERGDYVSLDELLHDMGTRRNKTSPKTARKTPRRR